MKDANGIPQNSPKFPIKGSNGLNLNGLRFYIVIFWPFWDLCLLSGYHA